MVKESGNIEELMKEAFNGFEADVPPNVWTNIQSGINSPSAPVQPTSASKNIWLKALGAAAVTAGVIAGVIYLNSESKNTIAEKENIENTIITEKEHTNVTAPNTKDPGASSTIITESTKQSVSGNITKKETPEINEPEVINENKSSDNKPEINVKNNVPEVEAKESPSEKAKDLVDNVQPPVAKIIASQSGSEAPITVTFSNDGNGTAYEWDFGDGKSNSKLANPTRVFDKPGEYKVVLTVKDANNNVSRDYITIKVKSSTMLYAIPTIFTPNGDYQNDKFEIKGEGLKSIEGSIIDPKTGKTIYQWYMPNESWNGKLSDGSDAPEGDYYYIFRYIGADDKTIEKKGLVKLKR